MAHHKLLMSILIKRAYCYIDGGSFEDADWYDKMYRLIVQINTKALNWDEQDINITIAEIWQSMYTVDDKDLPIYEWARIKKESTRIQNEMRNSMDRLFRAIEDFRSSVFFEELLHFCARFKLLAPYNAMMVKTQMPSAEYVLTERNWEKMYHRQPKRNARPLVVLRKFGPVDYVFEIGDTEPIPGTQIFLKDKEILDSLADPFATTGEVKKDLYDNLINALSYYGIEYEKFRVASDFGAEIRKSSCSVKVKGVQADGHYVISVNDRTSMSTAFASICHELGHFFCYHLIAPKNGKEDWWKWRHLSWEQKEFEAEIVSFIICERYGVGNKSWEYLSQVLGRYGSIPNGISIDRVFKAANEVERMLDDKLDPRSCYLYLYDKEFKKKYDMVFPKKKSESETS